MKTTYEVPQMEIITLSAEDVIVTSTCTIECPNKLPDLDI